MARKTRIGKGEAKKHLQNFTNLWRAHDSHTIHFWLKEPPPKEVMAWDSAAPLLLAYAYQLAEQLEDKPSLSRN